jgi:hypothetical protein
MKAYYETLKGKKLKGVIVSQVTCIYDGDFKVFLYDGSNRIDVTTTIDGKLLSQSYFNDTLQIREAVNLFKDYLKTI